MKYVIIAATQVSKNAFVGDIDDLTKIANTGNTQCFHVSAAEARLPFDEDDKSSGLLYPQGEGWYYSKNAADENHKADSQLEAVCAVLGWDTHFFQCFTEDEAHVAAKRGIAGHFGIEATTLLRDAVERYL